VPQYQQNIADLLDFVGGNNPPFVGTEAPCGR